MMRFRTVHASMVGSSHKAHGTECQDSVVTARNGNSCFAVLSDGAGSKKYAAFSSKRLCEVASELITDRPVGDILRDQKSVINELNSSLSGEDYGATLLFFKADSSGEYVLGHIGDGIILLGSAGRWEALSLPKNGYFANETFLLPDDEAPNNFEFLSGKLKAGDCIILVSDGLSDLLFDVSTGNTARACGIIEKVCRENASTLASEMLANEMETFFSDYTGDDMSIAVICAE